MSRTVSSNIKVQPKKIKKRKLEWLNTFKRMFKSPSAKLGGILFIVILLSCAFAFVLAPYDPYKANLRNAYAPISAEHWCGTDQLGRDIFSRLLYGGRYSLTLGLCAALAGNICGVILGSVAGYFGGRIEMGVMRFCDIWSAIPGILLTIIIAASLGAGFVNTIIAMSIGGIPFGARMTRGQILAERSKEYLEAAESINCSKLSIMFKHLLPNVISPTLVSMTMAIGGTITGAAGLAYLGLGVQPPTPEWGAMLSEGTAYIRTNPTLILFPGIVIGICVLSINLMGDGLRDALDPKLRK
jgi:ABC-type dipeptide/oligopeptide/nickel transport system permease subunit